MECDVCNEDWPSDFFCETCSSEPELRETTRTVLFWDCIDGHDTEVVEEYVYRSVCLNCCPGHRRSPRPPPPDPA